MKIFRKIILIAGLILVINSSLPVMAQTVALQELQSKGDYNKDHWVYKTLENVVKKHGLLVGKPEEVFNSDKPLTREEAAMILVNLTGKIKKDQEELNEAEKARLDILEQELKNELNLLTGRVAILESDMESLKGKVSKIEAADSKSWIHLYGEKFRMKGTLQAGYTANFSKGVDNYPYNFRIPKSEIVFAGKLAPHMDYVSCIRVERAFTSSKKSVLDDAYISTDILPHHKIIFGQTRVPIGKEGTTSSNNLDTIQRAQIGRNFGDLRDIGVKTIGDLGFVEYSVGAFNGERQNTNDTNRAMDIATWVAFKPLYKHPNLGKLELGGGYDAGKLNGYSRNTAGFYGKYQYKKYEITGEYAFDDGYKAANREAEGWYITNTYFLTDKLQLVARYDQFDPNKYASSDRINEYTLGTNYYWDNNIKFMLNLVHVDNKSGKNSNRFGLLSQYLF